MLQIQRCKMEIIFPPFAILESSISTSKDKQCD